MFRPLVQVAVLLMAMTWAAAASTDAEERVFSHAGLERALWVVDGRSDRTAPAPLILALHGYRKPEEAQALRDMPEKLAWPRLAAIARAEGLIAVFPAAYPRPVEPGARPEKRGTR